jgi:hypothetical protein
MNESNKGRKCINVTQPVRRMTMILRNNPSMFLLQKPALVTDLVSKS